MTYFNFRFPVGAFTNATQPMSKGKFHVAENTTVETLVHLHNLGKLFQSSTITH